MNQTADIWFNNTLAGHLIRAGNSTTFSYRNDYLTSGNPSIATTLPLSSLPFVTHSGAIPPFSQVSSPKVVACQPFDRALRPQPMMNFPFSSQSAPTP
ncbi:hypothetical protein CDES_05990 [Corynebacterium deserti GIMN1.010]|uniref:HipA N-terminal subdomain 1 domain-containing protein n=1 Tax=Corynebacterium deserti GIMN1.010 TaxID=931089 RepID=A0A0M4CDK4_9CORY|nr:hypothetical protein CDES_05990 [Corynebacterium deserti GIMN1.010]